jgi:hypothetical protein
MTSEFHPYGPDQQFGASAAADQLRADRLVAELETLSTEMEWRAPRAANRAGTVAAGEALPQWAVTLCSPSARFGPPPTIAAALDAAPFVRFG